MGACGMAPVVLVNNKKMHDFMTNEKIDELLEELNEAMSHARLRTRRDPDEGPGRRATGA